MEMQFVVNVIPKIFIAETIELDGEFIEKVPVYKWEECKVLSVRKIGRWLYEELRRSLGGTEFYVIRSYK